jgi:hypothetical protein
MKQVYVWLARLIAVGVVLQAAFITWGTFDVFKTVDDGKVFTADPDDYNAGQALHSVFGGMVIPLLVLVLLIVSFFAKVPRGVTLALIALGLVVLQFLLAIFSFGAPVVGLLHGINAFVLAGVAGFADRRASVATKASPPAEAPAAA